jgi:hypothetical protein
MPALRLLRQRRPAAPAPPAAAAGKLTRGATSLLDTPQPPRSRFLPDKPTDGRARWLYFEKLAFLIICFIAQFAGGIVLFNQLGAQTGAQHGMVTMALAALVATAIAAWFLYIDWGLAKKVALWLIVIALFGYGFSIWSMWDPNNRLLLNKLAGDALLLLWLLTLVYRDMQEYE